MSQSLGADENESCICSDALDDEGYVLGYPNSSGVVAKAAAGAAVYGVAYKSTKNAQTGVAEDNKPVAILRAPKKAWVQADTDANAIAIGDVVSVKGADASGKVKKHAATAWPGTWAAATAETIDDENSMIVGIARTALGANLTGKIEVLLLCPIPLKQ